MKKCYKNFCGRPYHSKGTKIHLDAALCSQRNVYKMSEKIFVTKSFKVLFYRSSTAIFDFISLSLIIYSMHPKRGAINLQL